MSRLKDFQKKRENEIKKALSKRDKVYDIKKDLKKSAEKEFKEPDRERVSAEKTVLQEKPPVLKPEKEKIVEKEDTPFLDKEKDKEVQNRINTESLSSKESRLETEKFKTEISEEKSFNLDFLNESEIVPFISFDKAVFGLTEKEITDIFGEPDNIDEEFYGQDEIDGNSDRVYKYSGNDMDLTFSGEHGYRLTAIYIYSLSIFLFGKDYSSIDEESLLDSFKDSGYSPPVKIRPGSYYEMKSLGLTFYFNNYRVDSVLMNPYMDSEGNPVWVDYNLIRSVKLSNSEIKSENEVLPFTGFGKAVLGSDPEKIKSVLGEPVRKKEYKNVEYQYEGMTLFFLDEDGQKLCEIIVFSDNASLYGIKFIGMGEDLFLKTILKSGLGEPLAEKSESYKRYYIGPLGISFTIENNTVANMILEPEVDEFFEFVWPGSKKENERIDPSEQIMPFGGYGNVLLGLTEHETIDIIGKPDKIEEEYYGQEEIEENLDRIYYYENLKMDLTFPGENDFKLAEIEVSSEDCTLFGTKFIGKEEKEVLSFFSDLGFEEPEIENTDYFRGIDYESHGLFFSISEEGFVESISISSEESLALTGKMEKDFDIKETEIRKPLYPHDFLTNNPTHIVEDKAPYHLGKSDGEEVDNYLGVEIIGGISSKVFLWILIFVISVVLFFSRIF